MYENATRSRDLIDFLGLSSFNKVFIRRYKKNQGFH